MNFQNELKKWADETADFYHNKATSGDPKFDLAFHTQSDLTKIKQSPELLILAINPGVGGTYSNQISLDSWKNWGVDKRMNGDTLLKGNPTWQNRNEWKFWQRLSVIFNQGKINAILQDESQYVLSNLTFFATANETLLPNGAFEECTERIIQLINILQPKTILCLGGQNCINPLSKVGGFSVKSLLPNNYLLFGNYKNIPVYAIKHTTWAYSREEMNLVRECLNYLTDSPKKDFSVDEIQEKFAVEIQTVKDRKSNKAQNIIDTLRSENFLKEYSANGNNKTLCFKINNKVNAGYTIVITSEDSGGYVAIGKRAENENICENTLKGLGFQSNKHWLGAKFFKDYPAENEEDLANGIKNDIVALIAKLNN